MTQRQFDELKRLKHQGQRSEMTDKQLSYDAWEIVHGDEPYPAYEPARRLRLFPLLRNREFQDWAFQIPIVQHLPRQDRVEAIVKICEKFLWWQDQCPSGGVSPARDPLSRPEHLRPNASPSSPSSSLQAIVPHSSASHYSYPVVTNDPFEVTNLASWFQSNQGDQPRVNTSLSTGGDDGSSFDLLDSTLSVPQNRDPGPQPAPYTAVQGSGYQDDPSLDSLSINVHQGSSTTHGVPISENYPLFSQITNYLGSSVDFESFVHSSSEPGSSEYPTVDGAVPEHNWSPSAHRWPEGSE